jgi:molybdopterin/thiamine biosynthesis adenylyltransferase
MRYSRQVLLEAIGEEGQKRLGGARVLLVGCGALGSVLANTLVRAGVGFVRICDRDFLELNNLQRQVLFDEDDLAANLPKAEAAAGKLRRINSDVVIDARVCDVNAGNLESLADDVHLILDGTDNFETRFLVNDYCVKHARPWVYGAVIETSGLCMTILPHDTPCLRCVFDEAPPAEFNPTCDTVGVLATVVNVVAGLQATEAIKLLTGRAAEINRGLVSVDVWTGRFMNLNVQAALDSGDCRCCKQGEYDYLSGRRGSSAAALCGRNAVQVHLRSSAGVDFQAVAERLRAVATGPVRTNAYLVRAVIGELEITLFADGRAIVQGTSDPEKARAVYAKYVGA